MLIIEDSLWADLEQKLIKSKRKWKPSETYMSYRYAELFCEECGKSMDIHDIVCTNLETLMYCDDCVNKYLLKMPYMLDNGMSIQDDFGTYIKLRYDNGYTLHEEMKICYFNSKGRAIKIKGKKYYLNRKV